MARTPNDDRSDSKNPNNSAYWASESNHRQQTRSDDDDDGWGVGPTWSAPSFGGRCRPARQYGKAPGSSR